MKLRYRIATRVIYWVWKIFFGFKVSGRENIPEKGGVIIAPNHLSNFDPPLVGTAVWFRECYFFSKEELFMISKFYSWLIKAFNACETMRKVDKKTLKHIYNLLNKGLAVILFPEGTRSKTGDFLDFNPGVGWLAMKCKVPVVPVLIKGTNAPLVKQLFGKSRVYIKFGTPITREEICKLKPCKESREVITREVRLRIDKLSQMGIRTGKSFPQMEIGSGDPTYLGVYENT